MIKLMVIRNYLFGAAWWPEGVNADHVTPTACEPAPARPPPPLHSFPVSSLRMLSNKAPKL